MVWDERYSKAGFACGGTGAGTEAVVGPATGAIRGLHVQNLHVGARPAAG